MPENNKYWLELTDEEIRKGKDEGNKDEAVEFIVNNI